MATLPGWLCIAGNEVINSCRTLAYINRGLAPHWAPGAGDDCDCCCSCVDDGDYTTPSGTSNGGNPAPWFDLTRPESGEFFGVMIADMHLSTPLVAPPAGSTYGRSCPIPVPRTMTITGYLVASTCRGTGYGREWLVRALGQPCVGGGCCPTRNATMLLWCPEQECCESERALLDLRLVSFELTEGDDAMECCDGAYFTAILESDP